MDNIKVLLVDDHQIIRDGIRALLSYTEGIEVVGECSNGLEAVDSANSEEPDVILMDINMPKINGIDATKRIVADNPECKILVLTVHDELAYISKMLHAGAIGYVLKTANKNELITAIKSVSKGEKYFSPEVTETMLSRFIDGHKPNSDVEEKELTIREIEVLVLISTELTNAEIGDKLCISTRTVDAHRRSLLSKLGARNTAGLVAYAIKNKFLD
ncbi:MAG: response regulator transcription factor [Flavobacteriales bacterium]|nr:response regulator transcription factor [Flavobacteriales bacterium]